MSIDMSQWSERFANGWDDETIDDELPRLSQELGLRIMCVWESLDEDGPAGDSELVVMIEGVAHELPQGLWDLLLDGAGDGMIEAVAGQPLPWDLSEAHWDTWQVCRRH